MKSDPWLKPGIWGAVVGAIVIMVLGSWQFGWVLGSTADQMARDRASTAVAEAVAPVCAAKFLAQPGAPAKVADLNKLRSDYEQRDFIEKGGWAVAIVSDAPDYQLASECAKASSRQNPRRGAGKQQFIEGGFSLHFCWAAEVDREMNARQGTRQGFDNA
jgi:hypothetical protein